MKKRIFTLLMLALLLVCICFSAVTVSAADARTGKCGDNLNYSLSSKGVLTISGKGKMWDFRNDAEWFDYHANPWENLKPQIKSVVFKSGITYIGADAFAGCEMLTSVVFTDTITFVGNFSFMDCSNLQNFVLPKKLEGIGQQAFDNCDKITSVRIPDTVTFLDGSIFGFCDALTDVYIGGSVDMGSYVYANSPFRCCSALEEIKVSPDNFALTAVDGVLYNKAETTLVQYPSGKKDKTYTFPATVEKIDRFAIEDNPYLETLVLPKSLKSVDTIAISGCEKLNKIYYAGTQAQWGKVFIDEDNPVFEQVTIYFNKGCKHTYTNSCDTTCNICNEKRTVTHTYKTTAITKATLTKNGSVTKKCSVCGQVTTGAIRYPKTFQLAATSYTYDGKAKTPSVVVKDSAGKVLKKGTDYDVTYASGRTNVGTYKVVVKMKGNYTGTKTLTFKINPMDVAKCTAKLADTSFAYDGKVKTPTVIVKDASGKTLKKDTDYKVTYASGRKAVGTYKVTVQMMGNYTGTKTLTFKITLTDISLCTVKLSATTYNYDGKTKTPTVTVKDHNGKTLKNGTDYKVTYSSGRQKAGTYKVTVKMKGNYTGTKTLTFKINPQSVSKCTLKLSDTSYTYNGKTKTPTVKVKAPNGKTLKKGTDYTVTYASGRKNVGVYKVVVKMKGNYTGSKTLTFKIIPKAATISKLTAQSKGITVKLNRSLQQSTGYELQYSTVKTFKNAKTAIVKSYKTSSVALTGLKAKATYYVRVRTYTVVNDVKYYSNWSTYKYIKTK